MRSIQLKHWCKAALNGTALAAILPCAVTCWTERRLAQSDAIFSLWAQLFAMVPGYPGLFLRRAFYRLTLEACDVSCHIGFGAILTHRNSRIEANVYIGTYTLVGSAWIRGGCLIGSRVSLLSVGRHHELDEDGHWTAFDPRRMRMLNIAEDVWIGEGAIVMADLGARSMVAAGSVVAAPVPSETLVAGNPARFIRKLERPGWRATSPADRVVV